MKKSLLVILLVLIAASVFAGVEWRAKLETSGASKEQNNTLITQAFAQGGNVKQVFESVGKENDLYQAGSYWLFKGAENSIYLVNPKEKTYSVLPLNAILQMAGSLGKLVKIKVKNPQVTVENLGAETILGYPCLHRKIVSEYDMEVKIAFIKSKSHERSEKEVWTSAKVKGVAELGESFRNRDLKTGFEELDALIAEQMKAEADAGFPLKMVTVTSAVDKKGKSKEKMRQTMEVLSIANKNFPTSLFEIPKDYEEKELKLGGE